MTKILIGSHAAKHHFSDFPREPKDFDYISPDQSLKCAKIDIHWNEAFAVAAIKYPYDIAPPILLHTLKLSHSFWPHHWEKTIFDLVFFHQHLVPIDEELLKLFYGAWENKFGKKRVCLDEENDEFFKDKVNRKYVHDDIHAAVAYNDEPMYMKIKDDLNSAMVSKQKFLALPYENQLQLCIEEISVIALERYLIPGNFTTHPKSARLNAGRDLVTRMSKGWFPRFIVENWVQVFVLNNDNSFVQKFKQALQEGRIRHES